MKPMVGWVLALIAFLVFCGCGDKSNPLEAEKKGTSMAASPVSVTGIAAESVEVVSAKATEDNDNFYVVATLKTKKAIAGAEIYLVGDLIVTNAGQRSTEAPVEAHMAGPLDQGATKDVTFIVSRYGKPGQREIVLNIIRIPPPGT